MNHASCLCGGVRLSFEYKPKSVSHCHCSMCRKFHGAAFGTYGSVARSGLVVEKGEELMSEYQSSDIASRTFCKVCGSSLFFQFKATPDVIDVALGLLDDDAETLPRSHIFYADRPNWSGPYDDGLPKFDQEGH